MERDIKPKNIDLPKQNESINTNNLRMIHSVATQLLENHGVERPNNYFNKKRSILKWLNGRKKDKVVVDSRQPEGNLIHNALKAIEPEVEIPSTRIVISTEPNKVTNDNYELLQIDLLYMGKDHILKPSLALKFNSPNVNPSTVEVLRPLFNGNFLSYTKSSPSPEDALPILLKTFELIDLKLNNREVLEHRRT